MVPERFDRRTAMFGIAGLGIGAAGIGSGRLNDVRQAGSVGRPGSTPPGGGRCDLVVGSGDSIQATVDTADPGDVICVEPGTYSEHVTIDVNDLTLEATDPRAAVLDAAGHRAGIRVEADGVTIDGFEIVGDGGTTSGISVNTSAGATEGLTVRNNHVHGMARAGGGGPFGVASWGLLSFGDTPLTDVLVEDNLIEDIGGDDGGPPVGIGIGLEEIEGDRPRGGAVVRRNTVRNLHDASVEIMGTGITLPGVGIAIQPLDGASSGAGDPSADVHRNTIESTSVDIVLGEVGRTRVMDND